MFPFVKWFTTNIANVHSSSSAHLILFLMKIMFSFPNPYQIVHSELNVILLVLKSHVQIIHYVSHHGCEVVQDYNNLKTAHCFCLWKTNFPKKNFSKLCFLFNFFTPEFTISSNKIPETKYWHLSNGLQLTS